MAVKRVRRVRGRRADDAGETKAEAQLAPPEEKKGGAGLGRDQPSTNNGTLPVPTGKLPQDLAEEDQEATGLRTVDPVVLGLFCFSVAFIMVIAYVIWSGWEPPK